jgi:hypothetical protein
MEKAMKRSVRLAAAVLLVALAACSDSPTAPAPQMERVDLPGGESALNYTVTGYVYHENTQMGISGATVYEKFTNCETTTTYTGAYTLSCYSAQNPLCAKATGYTTICTTSPVRSNPQNFRLYWAPYEE